MSDPNSNSGETTDTVFIMSDVAAESCSSCGSESLEEDEGMVVCTSCGKVVEESGGMRHDETQNNGMSNPAVAFMNCNRLSGRMSYEVIKRCVTESGQISTEARKVCFSVIEKLAERLCYTRDMKQELKKYVKDALDGEYYRSSRKKMVSIAAICAYITMIKNGKAVTVSEICSITDCEKQEFASMYYKYLSQYPQNHPGLQKLDDLIPCSLKAVSFEESEKFAIFKLIRELLALLDQVMLIESKCPTFLIFAAAFIAWKSLDRTRSSTRFSQFRNITKIRSDMKLTRVMMYVKELEERLISLSSSIPWISQIKLTRSTISQYVSDILQFKKTVVYDHKSQVDKVCRESETAPVAEEVVDGDREISDSEIDMYIRSSAEVSAVKRLKAACGDDDV